MWGVGCRIYVSGLKRRGFRVFKLEFADHGVGQGVDLQGGRERGGEEERLARPPRRQVAALHDALQLRLEPRAVQP